jgi:hypothetical protein
MAINWQKVREALPKTITPLLGEIQQAYDSGGDDPARSVDKALRGKISGLKTRFETIKKEGTK